VREHNRQVSDGVFAAMNDPRRPKVSPAHRAVPPALNFAPLDNAATALTDAASRFESALTSAGSKLSGRSSAAARVNAALRQAEGQLVDPAGLPNRSWYRHLLYAPGYYTGYGVKTVPGVREGIEQDKFDESEKEVARVAAAIRRLAALLDAVTKDLGSPK
jgi:N-acetylated-alpha-linked acidic dipeptidase